MASGRTHRGGFGGAAALNLGSEPQAQGPQVMPPCVPPFIVSHLGPRDTSRCVRLACFVGREQTYSLVEPG